MAFDVIKCSEARKASFYVKAQEKKRKQIYVAKRFWRVELRIYGAFCLFTLAKRPFPIWFEFTSIKLSKYSWH